MCAELQGRIAMASAFSEWRDVLVIDVQTYARGRVAALLRGSGLAEDEERIDELTRGVLVDAAGE